MAYLSVKLEDEGRVEEIALAIGELKFIDVVPNWHDVKAASMRIAADQVGVSHHSAPFKSLYADKEKSGKTYGISVVTDGGDVMSGQLRSRGLLISGKVIEACKVRTDTRVARLIEVINRIGCVVEVEIG